MPLEAPEAANFGQPRIVIDADLEVRIAHAAAPSPEFVCEAEHARVAGQLERTEMQVTVRARRATRPRVRDRPQIAHQPSQPHEIALVQRHQADEAAGTAPARMLRTIDPRSWSDYTMRRPGSRVRGRRRGRSMPVRSRILLEISSIEHSVASMHGNAVALEQRLRGAHLERDLLRRRIAAVGAPFVADLLQTVRLDRQAEQLARDAARAPRGSLRDSRSSSVSG